MRKPFALVGILFAATVLCGTTPSMAQGVSSADSATPARNKPKLPLTFELKPPPEDGDWRFETNRQDRVKALRPAMNRKVAELYYALPVTEAVKLKPGISRFKQPVDGFGRTRGRTLLGLSASFAF